MLRALPPYQVGRVIDFIHGKKEDVAVEVECAQDGVPAEAVKKKIDRKGKKNGKPKVAPGGTVTIVDEHGLFRNVPRSVKTEVARYLRDARGRRPVVRRDGDDRPQDAEAAVTRCCT